jgi:hypothetical protein
MQGYATGISNGFLCVNDVRRLENMDLVPDEEGGNLFLVNGSMTPLKNAGAAYQPSTQSGGADPPGAGTDGTGGSGSGIRGRYRKRKTPEKGKEDEMNKFWKWVRNKAPDGSDPDLAERTLFLNGTIASESWFDDDVTPALFKSDLDSGRDRSRSGSIRRAEMSGRQRRSTTCFFPMGRRSP